MKKDSSPSTSNKFTDVSELNNNNISKTRNEINNAPVTLRDKYNQDVKGYIPFSIIKAANKNDKLGGQTAREISQRGGYSEKELNKFLPGWRKMVKNKLDKVKKLLLNLINLQMQ